MKIPFNLFTRSVLISSVAVLAQAQSLPHQITLPPAMSWCDNSMVNTLFTEINSFRTSKGIATLRADALAFKVAEQRAVQFAQYMESHTPGSAGFNPHEGWEATAASAGYNIVGENLAYLSIYPGWIVWAGWQGQLHYAALTAARANVMGVSCVWSNSTPYWVYVPGIGSGSTTPTTPAAPPPPSTPTTPTTPTTPNTPSTTAAPLDAEQDKFLTLINAYRAQNGANPLQVSVALQNASQWMSQDMARTGIGSHTDSLGRSPQARMAAFGYTYYPNGENVAGGMPDAAGTFEQFKNACDPDAAGRCTYAHRVNMLNPSYVVIGIGRASGNSRYGWYWTTDFGGYLDRTITQPGATSPTTPTTPTTAPPVISLFRATPNAIVAGQSTTLSWTVTGATSLTIDGIGVVTGRTSQVVSPRSNTIYRLTATNAGGTVSSALIVGVTAAPVATPTLDTQAPSIPALTSAAAASATLVNLSWNGSTDNVGVAGYQIFRQGLLLAAVSSGMRSYADNSARASTVYTYAVRAYDAAGNYSALSAGRQVATPAATGGTTPATPTTPTTPPPSTASCGTPAVNAYTGCYYNNTSLSGTPVLVRTDPSLAFSWGSKSPAPSLTPLNFSARWEGIFTFQAGEYTFRAAASDGVRLYIDGVLVVDKWVDQPGYMYFVRRPMTAGQHRIKVEYYERTGSALMSLIWQKN